MPIVKCKLCGKKFFAKPSQIKRGWGKYCSSKCQYRASRKGRFVYCEICRKKIWRKPRLLKLSKSKKYFCNKSHQTLWRNRMFSGKLHPNWKNGENIRHKEFLIHKGVKAKCVICGQEDERILAVHHRDLNKKNNKVENLVFLCHNCHHLVHCYNINVPK